MPSITRLFSYATLALVACAETTTSPLIEPRFAADPISSDLVEDTFWLKKGWCGGQGGISIDTGSGSGATVTINGGTSTFISVVTEISTIQVPVQTKYFTVPGFTSTVTIVPQTIVTTIHNVETSVITVYGSNAPTGAVRTATLTLQGNTPQTITTVLA